MKDKLKFLIFQLFLYDPICYNKKTGLFSCLLLYFGNKVFKYFHACYISAIKCLNILFYKIKNSQKLRRMVKFRLNFYIA